MIESMATSGDESLGYERLFVNALKRTGIRGLHGHSEAAFSSFVD